MGIVFSNDDSQCLLIEPPNPVTKFYYRCDRKFHLDDLLNLYIYYDQHAIVLVSGKRTEIHIYSENNRRLLCTIKDILPNQHKKGGQSAQRFGRIRDEKILIYINKIIDKMVEHYTMDGKFLYKSIVIAGPAEIKQQLCNHKLFIQYFQQYLTKIISVAEITDQTIFDVIDVTINNQQNSIMSIITNMINDPMKIDLLVFGATKVKELYDIGALNKIYIYHGYNERQEIVTQQNKTEKNVFYSEECKKMYGELIGVRYFAELDIDVVQD